METNGNGHEKQNGSGVFAVQIDVVLTDQELNEKRAKVIEFLDSKAKIEAEKAEANKHFKVQLDNLEDAISTTVAVVHAGKERRMVECRELKDSIRCVATTVRADTLEFVSERALEADEVAALRQPSML